MGKEYRRPSYLVWGYESRPLAFSVTFSHRPGMLDNTGCVVSCTLKLLLVYFLIEWHVEGNPVAGIWLRLPRCRYGSR